MTWTEICIHTTHEASEAISNILYEAGATGVVIEDSTELHKQRESKFGEIYELNPDDYPSQGVNIKVYFPKDDHISEKLAVINKRIDQLKQLELDVGELTLSLQDVEEKDWETAWQKYYHPVNISNQITIVPTWHEYDKKTQDEKLLYLDPGMAFGTGTHATTKLCLLALEKYIQKEDVVLDVGCGSGVLSIGACLLGAREVHAFDLDPVAVRSTKHNSALNGFQDKIKVKKNNLLTGINESADVIVANILAEIIIDLIDDAWDNLTHAGYFITSGIILKRKDMVVEALTNKGFTIVDYEQLGDWVSIIAQKK